MLRITAILVLMLIGSLLAAPSCTSCGLECAPACGTRRFRTCCFNYLRKKRSSDTLQDYQEPLNSIQKSELSEFLYDDLPKRMATF